MRAAVTVSLVLFAVSPTMAQPGGPLAGSDDKHRVGVTFGEVPAPRYVPPAAESFVLEPRDDVGPPTEVSAVTVGPLRIGSRVEIRHGRSARVTEYRLQGPMVLGGSLGGSGFHDGATVSLSWPTSR